MRTEDGNIERWLEALGTLTTSQMSIADAKAKMRAYAALLREKYPPSCFCRASLEHTATACKFFPTYGEVSHALSTWWRDHQAFADSMARARAASSEREALPAPAPAAAADEPQPYSPEYLEARLALFESWPADRLRTMAARQLLGAMPEDDDLGDYRSRLARLAGAGDAMRTDAVPGALAAGYALRPEPLDEPPPPRRVEERHLDDRQHLRQLEALAASGAATPATLTRLGLLRQKLEPQPADEA